MKREELKTGAIVELREGSKSILIANAFIGLKNGYVISQLYNYKGNLINDCNEVDLTEYDIMKVWQSDVDNEMGYYLSIYGEGELDNTTPTWQRTEIVLSDIERVILENFKSVNGRFLSLVRHNGSLYISPCDTFDDWIDYEFDENSTSYLYLNHLFQFIKNEEMYSIKELLEKEITRS